MWEKEDDMRARYPKLYRSQILRRIRLERDSPLAWVSGGFFGVCVWGEAIKFRLHWGITVSFIYGVVYLLGTVFYGITTCCASFGITRLICVSDGITRLIFMSFGITRLIDVCVLWGHEIVLCRVNVMYEADWRGARRMREGHTGMFSLMLPLNVFIVSF
ncbi:hypothetical protein E5676_scaffold609G00520 [Cucumis melo var. makuwa]|uniref:Uncharacterized protein n=1 Tax=Cucumis melo var. makuwa TaxID=1194695 RepID=A0A5A7U9J5_CUCMM|nr:hypothetical protein E6C27_scaffold60G002690 [Cucumis melo var. makuwa]TYK21405.1 hypothetical protein E5676_scaffold609G00520 [Cucumis melo var. makuwa]